MRSNCRLKRLGEAVVLRSWKVALVLSYAPFVNLKVHFFVS